MPPRKDQRSACAGSGLLGNPLRRARAARVPFPLLLLAFLFLALSSGAQISPGPLSRPHQFLDGVANCTSCHKVGAQATFNCLECHTEIATRVAAGRGLHARLVPAHNASQKCATCHSEHNGAQFPLVRWQPPMAQFDHHTAGWVLDGKHAALRCEQCHAASKISPAGKSGIKVKDLNRTFLGLPRECVGCHADKHQGRLGTNCQQCHNASDWHAVQNFDHAKARYPLTGSHREVKCEKCHTAASDGKPRWTGLVFDRCNACHNDPHHGAFTASCQSCHTTSSWKAVPPGTLTGKFDHATTKYPLLGKHADVRCTSCHAGADFQKPIAFQKCSDCHRPDPHSGQFAKRADMGECSACHTVEGFKPATFGVKEHSRTAYPLAGKHAGVACAKCHLPAGKATLYKIKFGQCTDCHKDAHAGQFQAAPNSNRCESCHTVQGFRPSTFTLARHKNTRFQLAGGHVAIPCDNCHRPAAAGRLRGVTQYRFDDLSCTGCHRDPHRGQFRDRMAKMHDGRPAGCEACHTVSSWKDLSRFDHGTTRFALLGTHRAVACADCHKPPNLETKLINVDFRLTPSKCEECHNDAHGGQFANAAQVTPCAGCHTTQKWRPSTFDHDTRTSFPLQGGHQNVRCSRCHTLTKTVNEQTVTFYKPTPKECAACHGANVPKAP